ncbi:alpha-L-arabinofuranosidase A [Aspergillus stella-maris]|uniref:alpha-L-arabinofuranosidase A n=1 Tax=Aspergillus stella-maris TaxID=1810926 RepID=UPI003CCE4795
MKTALLVRALASLPDLGWLSKQAHSATNGASAINLTVLREGGNWSSPLLYGIMFEEMDHSGDGGIHGNLLVNNGFQGANPGLTGYHGVGPVEISRSPMHGLSKSITSSLSLSILANAQGYVGFANTGYSGIPVTNQTYVTSFYMSGDYTGQVIIRLVGSESGIVYARRNLSVRSTSKHFQLHEATLEARASLVAENEWQVLVEAEKARGHPLRFGLVQLFPPTFSNRVNGLRKDLAQPVADLKPSFLRFPGGNNLEGLDISSRWKWNETIGPLIDRPGRESDWHYPNTDALGLDEYLYWCEDMDMEPVLSIWDGKSYGGIVPGDQMQPYLDDTLNLLEYLFGSNTTTYGSLRTRNGHPRPWNVQYIEIGNEDDYSGGCDTYADRLIRLYDTIHNAYPNLTLIANNNEDICLPSNPLPGIWHDYHYYRSADDLVKMFNLWDNQPRDEPMLIGEYGCREDKSPAGEFWSTMKMACGEAVHMIGLERNSDVIRMAAYAPLLQHFGYTQWSPTLYGFSSRPGSLTLSTSYYVQKMFSTNRGTRTHPVRSSAPFGPVYWVATSNDTAYQVKLANYGEDTAIVNVRVPGVGSASLEVLMGDRDTANLPHNEQIKPNVTEVRMASEGFVVEMEAWSVAVLVVTWRK